MQKSGLVMLVAAVMMISGVSEAKKSAKKDKAAMAECKQENPGASKKELKKCVHSKMKKHS